VFSLTGYLAYQAFYYKSNEDLVHHIERELTFAEQELEMELYSVHAVQGQILNSAELINFINTENQQYQTYAFEASLYRLINRARNNNRGLEKVQILSPKGSLLFTSSDRNPFDVAPLPLPETATQLIKPVLTGDSPEVSGQVIFRDDQGALKFALLRRFSPNLLLGDRFDQVSDEQYLALLISKLSFHERLKERLEKAIGDNFSLTIEPADQPFSSAEQTNLVTRMLDDYAEFILQDTFFTLKLLVPEQTLSEQASGVVPNIIALVAVLTTSSFFILWSLIKLQIIIPINHLVTHVRKSHEHGVSHLEPLNSNDEISELNNEYLDLLKDVERLASFDPLTGLANRRKFNQLLERNIQRSLEQGEPVALLYIDLDNFKRVNDHYGHATGDRLLKLFSERLQDSIRPGDFAVSMNTEITARLAGDEFALLLTNIKTPECTERVADRILSIFNNGFDVDEVSHNVQASIGIAMAPVDGNTAQELLRHADAAMYEAKTNGKNRYQFFNQDIATELKQRHQIEIILNQCLKQNDFNLVYMPIYDAKSLSTAGVEVLLRCPKLASEGMGPDQFIPIAESVGLIEQIDLWVIDHALSRLETLQAISGFKGFFSINISAVELHNQTFPEQLRTLFGKYHIDPSLIELEITETSLAGHDKESISILNQLKEIGVKISLDDFGIGYTAFNQLAHYPVDSLKIDRSFVNNLEEQTVNKQPMVDIILSLANLYKLRVIAEGVETAEQLAYLQARDCHQLQGYHLSKPLKWKEIQSQLSCS
jgi:diguanylate cyclase (GGDEF)-like protein